MTGDVAIDIITPPPRESGYALIGTVWLLLLATGLAALLMVRATHGARALAALRAEALTAAHEESALETAAADILLNGTSAKISLLQGSADYEVSGETVTVTANSERARLDINTASLDVIDASLRAQRLSVDHRVSIIARIRQRQTHETPYASTDEVEAEFRRLFDRKQAACLAEVFTVHGGRTSLLDASVSAEASFQRSGAIRLTLIEGDRERRLIFHLGGGGGPPIVVIETGVAASCQ